MNQKTKVVFSWSGGKDSAMALYELKKSEHFEVVSLLTTVSEEYERISHHGVRVELLERQAEAIGIRLHKVYLPGAQCTNEEYEAIMTETMLGYKNEGVLTVGFGDIFLEDLRAYRERNLAKVGMNAIFPIWGRDTSVLVHTFIDLGFKAHLSCVEAKNLDESFAGRLIEAGLIRDLPEGVDPCGENGEFHSYVSDGPIFKWPVDLIVGEIVLRDVRYFADLIPAAVPSTGQPQDLTAGGSINPG